MNWLTSYEQDLEFAFRDAEEILSAMPEGFRGRAIGYLDKFHALKEHRSKNYICYLLPYWLRKASGAKQEDCHRFAVANLFGMMYYHLVDEAMDEPEAKSKFQLPLADLVRFEFMHIYSGYFPASSPFWAYYRKYAAEWADAVTLENVNDFFQEDPVRVAHKASPVKLTVAGTLLLTGREQLIPEWEAAVDTVLVTLQMLDDWEDWEKDLREDSYNCLISTIQKELGIPRDRRPTSEEIKQAIFVQDILSIYALRADRNHEALSGISGLLPHLFEFHDDLRRNVNQGAQKLQKERNLLMGGGLEYWLSKNMKGS
ncbi:hypothetical protein [Paenibacillus macerans]|uniref:hypothetical protein n=1 Tax=Paenibacillus macerans TaxID=44252 RepID=UPI003D313888